MRDVVIIFLLALAVRAGVGTVLLSRASEPTKLEFPDEEQYWLMASSLASGEGLRDELGFRAGRMPLYPAMLSLAAPHQFGVIAVKMAQWVVGAVVAALAMVLAGRLYNGTAGRWAGIIVALDPFLVLPCSLLLTESVFTVFVTMLWLVLCPAFAVQPGRISSGRWILAGVVSVLCVYTRESSLVLIGLGVLVANLVRKPDRFQILGSLGVAALILAALIPWAWRNQSVTGEWVWLTTRGGISLYDGVGPQATGASDLGDIKQMPAVQGLNETQWNRYFAEESIKSMRQNPGRVIRLAGTKLARTWNPLPNVETYRSATIRMIAAGWTLPIFFCAIGGAVHLYRRSFGGWRTALFLMIPAIYVCILHSIFVGSVRYRLPAMPFLDVLAAIFVAKVISAWVMDNRRERTIDGG